MKRIMILFLVVIGLMGLVTTNSIAQTATTRTYLSSAVTTQNSRLVVVNSTSGMSASSFGNPTYVFIDREFMQVTAVDTTSNTLTVTRGLNGTSTTTHLANAVVWYGQASSAAIPTGPFVQRDLYGSCTRTVQQFLPVINVINGNMFDCILSTTATTSNWVGVNVGGFAASKPYKKLAVTATTYTLLANDSIVGYNTNVAGTITIPALTGFIGKEYNIQLEVTGTTSLTIATSSGQLVNGATSVVIGGATSFGGVYIYGDGQNWFARRAH